jgi:hypothetical protein
VIDSDSDSDSESDSDYEAEPPTSPPTSPNTPPGTPPVLSKHEFWEVSQDIEPELCPEVLEISVSQPPEIKMEVEVKIEDLVLDTLDLGEVETRDTKEIVLEQISITLDSPESNYNKMSIKQLKDILTSKGVKPKHNMKKDELVDLVKDIEQEVTI